MSDYPAPPGAPSSAQPGGHDAAPPPTYDQAMGHQGRVTRAAGHAADSNSPGNKTVSDPDAGSRAGQLQHSSPDAIDRSAEEALQIQVGGASTSLGIMCFV